MRIDTPRGSLLIFLIPIFVLASLNFGCAKSNDDPPDTSRPITAEAVYCYSSSAVSSGVTLTSTAQFYARQVTSGGLQGPGAAQNIRYAEVQVLDSGGTVIQCGVTNATGNLVSTDLTSPLVIPKVAGTYTLKVNSRALNAKLSASVLSNPYDNVLYSISSSFTLTGAESTKAITLNVANYTSTLEGGAFNILDQLYKANEFLRSNSSCPTSEPGCSVFTVAPKINTFWAPGVDPGTAYLGLSYPISAYLRSENLALKGLYILGGKDGDSDCTDTDHFDNSIILHEYGHFLEEFFAKSDSPGGSHTGNGLIDPRLAWSEGWANFFQSAVLGTVDYQDTIRNSSCSTVSPSTKLQIDLVLDKRTDREDVPIAATEGIFRETSVSRSLLQAMRNSSASGQNADLGFALIWRAFTTSSFGGFAQTAYHFRNVGMFNKFLYDLANSNYPAKITNYSNVLTYEQQPHDLNSYALPITAGSCAAYTMTGGTSYDGSGVTPATPLVPSNTVWSLQKSARLYSYYWNGSGTFQIKLKYHFSSSRPDLDLYIYKEDHQLFSTSSMPGYSAKLPAAEPFDGTDYSETVTVPGLAAGTYLIHVNMDDGSPYNGITSTFSLLTGTGATLCP